MSKFEMTDLGLFTYFLGFEISRTKDGLQIHQKMYAKDLLSLAHLIGTKIIDTRLNVKIHRGMQSSFLSHIVTTAG